jgi:hypothetical protein
MEDNTKSDTASITVIPAGAVTLVNPPTGLIAGSTATLQAQATNMSNTGITWSATAGTIDQQGKYTAPATAQTVIITATSVEDPTISASAIVKISAIFDNNTPKSPNLLSFANAYGSTSSIDLAKYDLSGDGKIDDEDMLILFRAMGW